VFGAELSNDIGHILVLQDPECLLTSVYVHHCLQDDDTVFIPVNIHRPRPSVPSVDMYLVHSLTYLWHKRRLALVPDLLDLFLLHFLLLFLSLFLLLPLLLEQCRCPLSDQRFQLLFGQHNLLGWGGDPFGRAFALGFQGHQRGVVTFYFGRGRL